MHCGVLDFPWLLAHILYELDRSGFAENAVEHVVRDAAPRAEPQDVSVVLGLGHIIICVGTRCEKHFPGRIRHCVRSQNFRHEDTGEVLQRQKD